MVAALVLWALGCGGEPASGPAVQLVYGARGEGEIEPCGCPENPRGGLSRRHTALEALRAAGPTVVVDGGASLNRLGPVPDLPGALEQRQLKGALIAERFGAAGLDAMALSADDWRLGSTFVREQVASHGLPVVAANLSCEEGPPWPGGRVVRAGSLTIGVVGVTGGEVEGCEISPAGPALKQAVAALGEVDLVVGLVPFSELAELAPASDVGIDVVIDGRDRAPSAGAEKRGAALFVSAGTEGRSLGVLSLHPEGGAGPWRVAGAAAQLERDLASWVAQRESTEARLAEASAEDRPTFERQLAAFDRAIVETESRLAGASEAKAGRWLEIGQRDLDAEVPDHPETKARVEAVKDRVAMAGGEDPRKFVPRRVAEGPYLGGEGCVACHREQPLQWSTTAHARAWQGLVAVNRALDLECWSCHVTGAGAEGGPDSPRASAGFRDVQCEACHGPGRAHAEAPSGPEAGPIVRDPGEARCRTCHDGVRDEGRFDAATYRAKVVHPSVDP